MGKRAELDAKTLVLGLQRQPLMLDRLQGVWVRLPAELQRATLEAQLLDGVLTATLTVPAVNQIPGVSRAA